MRLPFSKQALIFFLVIDAVLIATAIWYFAAARQVAAVPGLEGFALGRMRLSSPAFRNGGPLPASATCDGAGEHPPLAISDVPEEAKSLVLVMEDPDAPFGPWTHWTVWNLPPSITELPAGSVPPGAIQGRASSQVRSYSGPCPPSGTRRYFFKLFALDDVLTLTPEADPRALLRAIEPHVIARAALAGTYRKLP